MYLHVPHKYSHCRQTMKEDLCVWTYMHLETLTFSQKTQLCSCFNLLACKVHVHVQHILTRKESICHWYRSSSWCTVSLYSTKIPSLLRVGFDVHVLAVSTLVALNITAVLWLLKHNFDTKTTLPLVINNSAVQRWGSEWIGLHHTL